MNLIKIFLMLIPIMMMLPACGSNDDETRISDQEMENRQAYIEMIRHSIDESNKLLKRVSKSLDNVYTGERNITTFRSEIEKLVPESSALVTDMNDGIYLIRDGMFDFHRQKISLLSKQHAMLLNAVESIDNDQFSKSDLQREINDIKVEQTRVVETLTKGFNNE
ncbi:hypothetical protein [Salipaludibacillus sp. CF4.18]|uniref:hypothetical protein n=1 Tax=Salipaludibacillus sp. CF4.18 TaxID=3373081 RepID=UPI003EE5FD4F